MRHPSHTIHHIQYIPNFIDISCPYLSLPSSSNIIHMEGAKDLPVTMDHEYPDYLQYTWSSPAMRATAQSPQMLQGVANHNPYHVPFPDLVHSAQYQQVDHESQQKHPQASPWNTVSSFSYDSGHACLEYPPFHYPASPPNLFQYINPFPSAAQQPSPFTHGHHTGKLNKLLVRIPSKAHSLVKSHHSPNPPHPKTPNK